MKPAKIIYLFTRTPLHVGAGASVGAIDQPVIRERHTGFPVIPASSLKGSFADAWSGTLCTETDQQGKTRKVRVAQDGTAGDAAWLFGSDNDQFAAVGALRFSEARLLAFPIRSARGSFAWITCPLMLQRAARDGVFAKALLADLPEPGDDQAIFDPSPTGKLSLNNQVVLEEYTVGHKNWMGLARLCTAFAALPLSEPLWTNVGDRLVILGNGMMSFFARHACEVAQHVRINDETGTAAGGALFNQENIPSETLFYSVLHASDVRSAARSRPGIEAIRAFQGQDSTGADQAGVPGIRHGGVVQLGGDASTGLGYCTVCLGDVQGA